MEGVHGLGDIFKEGYAQCGIPFALLIIAIIWLAARYAQVTKALEAALAEAAKDRIEAVKRIDAANANILKLIEASNDADKAYAVALNRLEVMFASTQSRKGADR